MAPPKPENATCRRRNSGGCRNKRSKISGRSRKMSVFVAAAPALPWWKEPTKDQWYAYIAAWLGWTLDAFDFTIFLLIMLPISQEVGVALTAVTAVFTLTLWMRLVGATGSGWLAARMGRKQPLMISICLYSVCHFLT